MKVFERLETTECTLSEIYNAVAEIQKDCADYMVSDMGRNLCMTDKGSIAFKGEEFALSRWALFQLGIKTGVPGAYLEKCIDAGFSALAADNVNTWLRQKESGTALIRTFKDTARGILSKRYTACDAPDIVEMIDQSIDALYWKVRGHYISEERMHFRMVSGDTIDVNGMTLFPAIFFDSSDVGRCALNMRFGLYRSTCRNGIILPSIRMFYHQRHIGIDKTELFLEFNKNLGYLPEMMEEAENILRAAALKQIDLTNTEEVEALIHELRVTAQLTEDDARDLLYFARDNYDDTRLGLANALSEMAQDKTLEKRLDLEKAAGKILCR